MESLLEDMRALGHASWSEYLVAVDKLKSETYDVVILDIMGVRGFDKETRLS